MMLRGLIFAGMLALTGVANATVFGTDGASTEPDFLPADQAFKFSSKIDKDNVINLHWDIEPHYYLYKKQFRFSLNGNAVLGEAVFDREGDIKDDPNFGRVEIFHDKVDVSIPVSAQQAGQIELDVRYQGCAEAGLCYPPKTVTAHFDIGAKAAANDSTGSPSNAADNGSASLATAAPENDLSTAGGIVSLLQSASTFKVVIILLGLGFLLCFTPCVLPMVPILSSIIVGHGEEMSGRKGFMMSLAYVIGMSSTYAVVGLLVGLSGAPIQTYLQIPAVLWSFAALFGLLSLAMFGFYELQLPAFLRDKLNDANMKQKGGSFAGVMMMGVLSALLASPCVSVPLVGILLFISTTGDALLGFIGLFAVGFGMGIPLLAVGATGGSMLPKAGAWMDQVKALFGVALLAVAAWMVKHLVGDAMPFVWGTLLVLAGIYLGALDVAANTSRKLFKGMGIAVLAAGVGMILVGTGIARGVAAPAVPGAEQAQSAGLQFKKVRSLTELEAQLAQARASGQTAMVDYYADWCTACLEMEHSTFKDAGVKARLSNSLLIQADLTNNDEADALLKRAGLFGPPGILFFDRAGNELKDKKLVGGLGPQPFLKHLETLPH